MKYFFLLFVTSFLVLYSSVFACLCIEAGTPEEELNASYAVFAGRVLDIDYSPAFEDNITPGWPSYNTDSVEVIFKVSKIWKGPPYKTLVLYTYRGPNLCEYDFLEGEEYLVYAYGNELRLGTDNCGRTQQFSKAVVDKKKLGAWYSPWMNRSNIPPHSKLYVAVVDANSSRPLFANITLEFFGHLEAYSIVNTTTPTFRNRNAVFSNVTPGIYRVTAETDGYVTGQKKFVKMSNETGYLVLFLKRPVNDSSIGQNIEKTISKIIPPETLSKMLIEKGTIDFIRETNTVRTESQIFYIFKGTKIAKLLILFPIEMEIKVKADAETGNIIKIERPFWSLLTSS